MEEKKICIFTVLIMVFGMMLILKSDEIVRKIDNIHLSTKYKMKLLNGLGFLLFSGYIRYQNYSLTFTMMYSILFLLLYFIQRIDQQDQIIPHKYPFIIAILGIINILLGNTHYKSSIMGFGLIILFFFFVVAYEYFSKNEDILGGGDIKLLFSLSIFLGFFYTYGILFLSHLIKILTTYITKTRTFIRGKSDENSKDTLLPFVPYIYVSFSLLFLFETVYFYLLRKLG